MKLAQMIKEGSLEDSPHLITSYAVSLQEEEFDLDEENDLFIPKNESFLKNIEDRCNLEEEGQKENAAKSGTRSWTG